MAAPHFLVVDPAHYEIAYAINPWMHPTDWSANPEAHRRAARQSFNDLTAALRGLGATLEILPGTPGAPDLVFPANAAVVLDGRALLARFLNPERQTEEPIFHQAFLNLQSRGLLREVALLPEGAIQEGAGDCIWDATRQHFWAGHGPRSNPEGITAVAQFFHQEIVPLELATPEFYHLDTCFSVLPAGEILYYPTAFTPQSRAEILNRVPSDQLIEATKEDANRFCVNMVCIANQIIMAQAAPSLPDRLTQRGYKVTEINLDPFIRSGGAAFCMTLRLDRASTPTG